MDKNIFKMLVEYSIIFNIGINEALRYYLIAINRVDLYRDISRKFHLYLWSKRKELPFFVEHPYDLFKSLWH